MVYELILLDLTQLDFITGKVNSFESFVLCSVLVNAEPGQANVTC